jgi:hypothetical protein
VGEYSGPPAALDLDQGNNFPKITLSGTQLTTPSGNAAIAQPLTDRRQIYWCKQSL